MYLEEEDTPRIVEVVEDRLDFDSDNEDRLADLYLGFLSANIFANLISSPMIQDQTPHCICKFTK